MNFPNSEMDVCIKNSDAYFLGTALLLGDSSLYNKRGQKKRTWVPSELEIYSPKLGGASKPQVAAVHLRCRYAGNTAAKPVRTFLPPGKHGGNCLWPPVDDHLMFDAKPTLHLDPVHLSATDDLAM